MTCNRSSCRSTRYRGRTCGRGESRGSEEYGVSGIGGSRYLVELGVLDMEVDAGVDGFISLQASSLRSFQSDSSDRIDIDMNVSALSFVLLG